MSDLLKRLQAMGLKIEKIDPAFKKEEIHPNLEETLNGYWIKRNSGSPFCRENTIPYGNKYGLVTIRISQEYKKYSKFWGQSDFESSSITDFLFIDTETSGLSMGSGTLIFLFGACYFSDSGLVSTQLFLENPADELVFISEIDNLIKNHRFLVSYNGKSFDLPLLRTRMGINKFNSSSLIRPHIDLLHFARMMWRSRLENRRLRDIESEIIGFERGDEEIPGWLIPQIYRDYLNLKDPELLSSVFYHNECDVVSLAVLFLKINSLLITIKEQIPDDQISIGKIFQRHGDLEQAQRIISAGISKKGINNISQIELLKFADLLKKLNKWEEAEEIWKGAFRLGNSDACIELAKYYEHVKRDNHKALYWAKEAFKITPDSYSESEKDEFNKRIFRLERKLHERR